MQNHKYAHLILCWILPSVAIIAISFLTATIISKDFANDCFTRVIIFVGCLILLLSVYFLMQWVIVNIAMLTTLKNNTDCIYPLTPNIQTNNIESKTLDTVDNKKHSSFKESSNTTTPAKGYQFAKQNISQIMSPENIESAVETAAKQDQKTKIQILEEILDYTVRIMSPYMDKECIGILCKNIELYAEEEYPNITETVITNGALRSIDLRHFGWNIGRRLNYSGRSKATFIKKIFEQELKDSEISSLEQNLKQGGNCIIHIDEPEHDNLKFHLN